MTKYSRRDFIRQLGAFTAGAIALGRPDGAFSAPDNSDAFDFLVVGDSLVWGQGLREEQKFYHLTKQWLEAEVFQNRRPVNLKVKAHSGASINLRPYESEALYKAEIGEEEFFHPEINLSFPSIRTQLDVARKEYKNPEAVNLIMLSGGITDIRLTTILNPLKDNDDLRREIARHCGGEMHNLLEQAATNFPNALLAVVGYYPFISKYTPTSKIFNNLLELYRVPAPLKAVINNPLKRQLLRYYRNKMVERSVIWAQESTLEFKKAVDRLNAKFRMPRAVFIESPIGEKNTIGSRTPLLFDIGKRGGAQDERAAERLEVCKETLDRLRKQTDLKLRSRTCELATVGHPNQTGAQAYAKVIQNRLRPLLNPS